MITDLKTASRRREDEGRRISEEVSTLKGLIPKALEGQKDLTDGRLKELGSELKSLKTLIGNRMGGTVNAPAASARNYGALGSKAVNGSGSTTPRESTTHTSSGGSGDSGQTASNGSSENQIAPSSIPAPVSSAPSREGTNTFGSSGGRAVIPAWQMAASTKAKSVPSGNTGETATTTNAEADSNS